MKPKLKICGMKHNTREVAQLLPEYLGFIFYDKSPRNFEGIIPPLPKSIQRVGVFVNATHSFISEKIKEHNLDIVQLHGEESPEFCESIRNTEVWKVFSIKDTFDFEKLKQYETGVDKFLFDTQGQEKGGNGIMFNWDSLRNYPSKKPFILSGGIGLEALEDLKEILKTSLPIHAIDVNSRFEIEPGLKNCIKLKKFQHEL